MMQQNLIDAARAVIAANRAGELTDEHIQALEAAANAEKAAAGEPVAWRHNLTHSLHDLESEVQLADCDEWAEPLYAAPPVMSDAYELLSIWQTWLGAGRESCSEYDKQLWDRIDAVLAGKEPKYG
ncbi:hypothetical protein [Chromobacterium haemolyticum]|uniref:hypothetical protein n=1 Tax=Chromobacterium haemolyticum TaxID=394935 RepID=UPI001318DAF6|nr:hypothetical protein [Chromobacterium haemolyticum]BBH12868.1 hypothetical protein CH06BL_21160 [Chromobacterium haemolyticum]